MLVDKFGLAVSKVAGKSELRSILNNVKVTETDKTIECQGTDGHVLGVVSIPRIDPVEFPDVGFESETEPVLIPTETAVSITKKLSNNKGFPILQNAFIGKNGKETTPIVVTDLETKQVFDIKKPEGTYPETKQIFPKNQPVFEIGLGLKALEKLVQFVKSATDIKDPCIKFSFQKDNKGNVFSVPNESRREIKGIIMPMRFD